MKINFGLFNRKRNKDLKKRGKSGNKLASRMAKRNLKDQIRSERILSNSGKATRPGTLQSGRPLPWNRF